MAEEQATAENKNKKINRMSLAEVEAAIKKTEEHMKGLTSHYAQNLVTHRDALKAGGK